MKSQLPTALALAMTMPSFIPTAALAQGRSTELEPRRLDNGLDVLVIEKHQAPIVTIEVAVKTGAFTEDKSNNGLSHLYEHMFFKGNAAIPSQEAYMKRISELGISFNGTTGNERVNYFITLPSKNFTAGMQFMSDALLTPLFNPEELEKERLVVCGEYDRNESSPEYWLHQAVGKAAYGDDFLRKNPLGVRETILSATRETMRKFKETYYIPNNSLLCIVGDVNPTEANVLVDKLFGAGAWRRGNDPFAVARPPMPRLEKSKAVVVGRDKAVPTLAAVWNGPDTERDTQATFVGDVWGTLVGLAHGRFQKTLTDGGLATHATLSYFTQRSGGEINFGAQLRKPATEVRDALFREISAMADEGYFTEEDLAIAKAELRTNRAYERESGERLSHDFTFWWASASLDYYGRYLEECDKVSLRQIRDFVRNYLVGRPCVLGVVMDPKALAEAKLDEATLLGTPPEQRGSGLASAVKAITLSNGVRAIVRTDPGAPIGALDVFIDGGVTYLTKETQGAERLALSSALEGSKEHPRNDLRKDLARLGARVAHDSGYDYSVVAVQAPLAVLEKQERTAFAVACDEVLSCLRVPEFDPTVLEQKRAEVLQSLEKDHEDPDRWVWRLSNNVFFAGHPYANRPDGTLETVKAFTEPALRQTLERGLQTQRLLLVLVSDMSADDGQKFLERLFGWVTPRSGDPAPVALAPFHPTERVQFEKRDTKTTYIAGKFPLPAPNEEGYAAAKVLMQIAQRRFWDAIRTKYALSYAPFAGISAYRGNFGVVYATSVDPTRTVTVMFEELQKLKDELVPASELQGIVMTDVTRRAQRSEGAGAHASALGAAELVSGGWHRYYDENDDLARVTPEQVREAARKLLGDVRWGLIGPSSVDEKLLAGAASPSDKPEKH
jgi:zinc protease